MISAETRPLQHNPEEIKLIPDQRREATDRASQTLVAFTKEGETLLNDIEAYCKRFLFVPSEHYYTVAVLWAVHTHTYLKQRSTPRLHCVADGPEQGKTELLKVIRAICSGDWGVRKLRDGAFLTARTSGAGLVAMMRKCGHFEEEIDDTTGIELPERWIPGSIFIDDYDSLFERADSMDIQNVFNMGYMPGNDAIRVGAKGEPEILSTYVPLALAGIRSKKLKAAAFSRCITLTMRAPQKEGEFPPERFNETVHTAEGDRLRKRAQAFARKIEGFLGKSEPKLPVTNRAYQLWEPLYSIAMFAGKAWTDKAMEAILYFNKDAKRDSRNDAEKVLELVHKFFKEKDIDRARTDDIIKYLNENGFPDLKDKGFASLIGVHVKTTKLRIDGIPSKGLRRVAVETAYEKLQIS